MNSGGLPGSVSSSLLGGVAKLLEMFSPSNTFRKHLLLHAVRAENLGNDGRCPLWAFVMSGTEVQCIAGSSNFENCCHFLYLVTILGPLQLGGFSNELGRTSNLLKEMSVRTKILHSCKYWK